MIYDVRQTTTYTYGAKVGYARHVLRLTPVDRARQRVQAVALDIEPAPVGRREGKDFFGNRLTWIELHQPHDTLSIKVAARVTVETLVPPGTGETPPWETVRNQVFTTADGGPHSPFESGRPRAPANFDR